LEDLYVLNGASRIVDCQQFSADSLAERSSAYRPSY
jgi:hypothetical protein